MKLVVGQKLFITPSYLDTRNNNEPKEVTIKKVGKKYFQIEEYSRNKYSIETLTEVNNTNYKGQCYFTLQEILDFKEYSNLLGKLKKIFSYHSQIDISLNQLRDINKVLFPE